MHLRFNTEKGGWAPQQPWRELFTDRVCRVDANEQSSRIFGYGRSGGAEVMHSELEQLERNDRDYQRASR